MSAFRSNAGDKKLLTVSQSIWDQPAILKSWFFPDDNVGLEFRVTKPANGDARLASPKGRGITPA